PRLLRLEQDAALRQQRCQSPALYCTNDGFRQLFNNHPDGQAMLEAFSAFDANNATNQSASGRAHTTWLNLRQQAFPVQVAAWQRARQPGYEWQFDQPARYLCDPQARYPAHCLEQAQAVVEGDTADESPEPLESGAWAHCLER
ncbi:hypothetical protein NTD90_20945, partial [Pseudomonas sp. 20S_6.2_Bac1]|nr:hypothetical protein [Pseudomonas sp. 20S_6.2_Bac1]